MTNRSQLLTNTKSPIFIVGLFCLLLLVSACTRTENPDDVTIAFWTALTENDLEEAAKYSIEGSAKLFDKHLLRLRNASLQVGKTRYNCDGASVNTYISLQSAGTSSSFDTLLIRDYQEDVWKVDYPRTIDNIDKVFDKRFKNIVTTTKEKGKEVKVNSGTFFKALWQSIVTVFKELKDRLLS
jgi:hypothetical protein